MGKKNELIIVQNFSSEEFSKHIIDFIGIEINKLRKELDRKDQETYLTRKETAKYFKISLTCLNEWSKKGILIPLKLGNRTYFRLSDIEKKLNSSNSKNPSNEI